MSARLERRKFGRRATSALAWIRIDGRPRLPCTVANISPQGAFLELKPPGWLPFRFVLQLEADGSTHWCELRHVLAAGVGVVFRQPEAHEGDDDRSRAKVVDADDWLGVGVGRARAAADTPRRASDTELRKALRGRS